MQRGAAREAATTDQPASDGRTEETPRADRAGRGEATGMEFPRFFTLPGVDPFDEVEWELRTAVIGNETRRGRLRAARRRDPGLLVAAGDQHRRVEVLPRPDRQRPSASGASSSSSAAWWTRITEWARASKYFAGEEDLQAFSDDLKHLLVYQKAAFNSPVWFNCGFEKAPQCSACFINSVQDTMDSILTLARTEGMLFKFGSGTGTNLSPLRSSRSCSPAAARRPGRCRS